jgi:iron complex transport system substrate-binding protein
MKLYRCPLPIPILGFLFFVSLQPVLAGQPKRIISLAPSITESLYQLGLGDNLIAVTSYCNYPKGAKEKIKIGTLINPNVEKIFSLSPDLVLTIKDVNRSQTIEKLKNLGLKVVTFQECKNFSDILERFMQLAVLVGKESRAERIIKQAKEKVADITKDLKGLSAIRVFWQVNARPLITVGIDTFANSMIEFCGGINIFSELNSRYPRVSYEEVLLRNPEVIILVTMGDITDNEKLFWQRFKQIDAVKNGRVYLINADLVCRPTVASFLMGLEKVADILRHNRCKNNG